MKTTTPKLAAALLLALALAACGGRSEAPQGGPASSRVTDPQRAACVAKSPYLKVGEGLDAPGRLEVPVPAVGTPASCKGNSQFRFGSGRHDITGVVANTSGMGWENPAQVFAGLHTRQYARAFALESPCNGKRVMVVVADIGIMTGALRSSVLSAIAADPALASRYSADNLMLSATHTHQGPAGYSHHLAHNLLHLGFDPAHLEGVELLPQRLALARRVLPSALSLHEGDACAWLRRDGSADVVLQSTVFSSLLDAGFQQRLAQAMWETVRPGGGVLWYDFTVDNPRNRDVRGVPPSRIAALFPQGRLRWQRLTLAPPLGRVAARWHPAAWTALNTLPWLRTHVLAWVHKA